MFWVTKVFVTSVRLQTQPKIYQKLNLERKNQNFWFMGKRLSYNFHIWKNAYHRVFIQFSVRMELYEIVWQEVSHIWKLYDKKFWSTRESSRNGSEQILNHCFPLTSDVKFPRKRLLSRENSSDISIFSLTIYWLSPWKKIVCTRVFWINCR